MEGGSGSLVLSASADHIVGMGAERSRAILDELLAWTTQRRFCYAHHWQVGDVVVLDNTGMLHRALPYHVLSERTLHRTAIMGDEAGLTLAVVVLLFGGRALPRPLAGLAVEQVEGPEDIDAVVGRARRLIVVGSDAELATVLTWLLRLTGWTWRVGHATGWRKACCARRGTARRVPLIRDDTGQVIARAAQWLGADGALLRGEAVVDDTQLFDGEVTGVRIATILAMPWASCGSDGQGRWRWVAGRAVQLGTMGRTGCP